MIFYFNSKMVRLWVIGFRVRNRTGRFISIPKWYDYEGMIYNPSNNNAIFQFQNGTIMRMGEQAEYLPRKNFNSKMVRLWVLLNLETTQINQDFNSKMVRLWGKKIYDYSQNSHISIPKWYDYEFRFCSWTESSNQISIPKWYDYEFICGSICQSF